MQKPIALILAALLISTLACSFTDDAQKAIETVSKSAELLQEIADSGTFKYIADGMTALDNQPGGYASRITLLEGTTDTTGQTITDTTNSVVWTISTDEQGSTHANVVRNDETYEFISVEDKTYRIEDGQYRCVAYKEGDEWLTVSQDENDLTSVRADEIFAGYSFLTAGLASFSVAEKGAAETINGVATTQYTLVNKLDEAKTILSEFPSDDLQQSLEDVPAFYVNGTLYIADESKALMRYQAQYANLDDQKGNQFNFEVTELGNQPDITAPQESQITVPCTGGKPIGQESPQ